MADFLVSFFDYLPLWAVFEIAILAGSLYLSKYFITGAIGGGEEKSSSFGLRVIVYLVTVAILSVANFCLYRFTNHTDTPSVEIPSTAPITTAFEEPFPTTVSSTLTITPTHVPTSTPTPTPIPSATPTPAPLVSITPSIEQGASDSIQIYRDGITINRVQQSLNNLGFDCGTVDGILGSQTKDRIIEYQTQHNLTVNGIITDELLDSLDFEECRKEAEEGDKDAQFYLGNKYQFGHGVPQNDEEAVKWYRKAAKKGVPGAQYGLGWMYYSGSGVSQSYEEAMKWFMKAAEQEYESGQYMLGVMYFEGKWVSQNYEEAFKWFKKLAEQEDESGQFMVGYMYKEGLGVPEDKEQARYWFQLAADQGDEEAERELAELK